MGFIWEPIGVVVKASAVVEMRDAVNTLTDLKTAPRFNWQQSVPVAGDMITAARYKELQDATDYADNRNVCLSDKAAHYGTYDTTENSADDASNDNNEDVTNNVTIYTAHDIGYDATKYAQVDNDQNVTYNAARDIGYDSSLDSNYKSALYTTNNSSKNLTIHSAKHTSYDSDANGGAMSQK